MMTADVDDDADTSATEWRSFTVTPSEHTANSDGGGFEFLSATESVSFVSSFVARCKHAMQTIQAKILNATLQETNWAETTTNNLLFARLATLWHTLQVSRFCCDDAAQDKVAEVTSLLSDRVESAAIIARGRAENIQNRTMEAADYARNVASDPKAQAVGASAAGGAVVVGALGGAAGTVGGGVVGAAVGLPTALFTFGLSIPVCSVICGTLGGAGGTAVGSTVGLVGGGATGYGVYSKKDEIRSGAAVTLSQIQGSADYVKEHVQVSARNARAALHNLVSGE